MNERYAIGVDFGTLSGRAVLVRVSDGAEISSSIYEYSRKVMDETLPDGTSLPPDFALQDPQDYLTTFYETIPAVIRQSQINPDNVIGIGVDFTACTMLPTKADGTPLCFLDEWRSNPHSWVKLWKHHAAQDEANKINEVAARRGEEWLPEYGGKISSEWFFPKAWQILDEAPDVYEEADRLIEATDWVIWQLTGVETRNACTAGYKAIWSSERGFPSREFLRELDPRLENIVQDKMQETVTPPGKAGSLTEAAAEKLGLQPGIAVAVGHVDAHAAAPAAGLVVPGRMVMIMGTSTCHMVIGEEKRTVEGMCGVVKDGIIPGYYGFEAGQSAVGDIFGWFVDTCVPAEYEQAAAAEGQSIHEYLEAKARDLRPGESGLLALDWWNGNRSVLVDADLTGLLLGMTLTTKPEEIYRALIEATAFGTRMIIEALVEQGVAVDDVYACGGLPEKNRMLMQIYADVTGKPFKVADSQFTPAVGAAMWAAVSAGEAAGGYRDIASAAQHMVRIKDEEFQPDGAAKATYDRLYAEYQSVHDYFGRSGNDVMKRLKALKVEVRGH